MSNVPENITLAIEKSTKNVGSCVYHDNGPCCVIAHLGQLHGIDSSSWRESYGVTGASNDLLAKEFLPYPEESLELLQNAFDTFDPAGPVELTLKRLAASLDWE